MELITNWPKNLYLDFRPLEFLYFIFNTSSNKPRLPKLNETKIKVQTYIFDKSDHKSVLNQIPIMIITPPIVGVPDFFII